MSCIKDVQQIRKTTQGKRNQFPRGETEILELNNIVTEMKNVTRASTKKEAAQVEEECKKKTGPSKLSSPGKRVKKA